MKEKSVKIHPRDLCPCGSGLKYKDCCKKKHIHFKTLGENYKNEDMMFNSTENNKTYEKISNILLEEIANQSLTVTKGKEILKRIYDLEDKGLKQFERYSSCSKGCGHCCHMYADCTAIEAELIREYVVNNFTKEEIDKLQEKIHNIVDKIPNHKDMIGDNRVLEDKKYFKRNIPCIFLNEENSCMIYKARTINCRKFLAITPKENCLKNSEVTKLNSSVSYISDYAINCLSMSVTRYSHLKENVKGEETSIYKAIPMWFKKGFEEIDREIYQKDL